VGNQEIVTLSLQVQDWLVWVTPLVAVPLIPIVGRIGERARSIFAVAVSTLTAGFAVSLLTSPLPRESSFSWISAFTFDLNVDGLSVFLALIVNLLGLLIVIYSTGYMKREKGLSRYYGLVLLFIGSMTGLVLAGNLLQLYIFWELVGICSSFLIAFWYERPDAVRAGLKAFLITRVGDIGLLIGLVYLYVNTGTVTFAGLEQMARAGLIPISVLTTGGILVFLGAMGKSAQFPLHVWLPDAMEGPSTVSALIHAATMVNAGVYLVARTYPIFSGSSTWLLTVEGVGLFTALAAAPLAMTTPDLKRVLAYSTISQLGLMFAAIGLGSSSGLFAGQFHLMSQAAFKALAFLAAGSVIHVLGIRDMDQMGGLRKTMPLSFLGFAFATVAMVGIPPFIGFWSKDLILTASIGTGNLLAFSLILIVSIMTSFYSFRALFRVFIVQPTGSNEEKVGHESPWTMTAPLAVLSASVALLFVAQPWAANLLGATSESLSLGTILFSLFAISIGLATAYLVYLRRRPPAGLPSRVMRFESLRRILLEGYGFDQFYDRVAVRPVRYTSEKIRSLQTGKLGVNLWAVLVFVAIFLGVLLAWST
jgi:NADH-quinone oxidoreductase subunit L